jgi:hypothetical protein
MILKAGTESEIDGPWLVRRAFLVGSDPFFAGRCEQLVGIIRDLIPRFETP